MKKFLAVALMSLVIICSLTGCGSGISGTTWKLSAMNYGGTIYDMDTLEELGFTEDYMYFVFADETCTVYIDGEGTEIGYTYEDGVLSLDGYDCTLDGSTFTLTGDESSLIFTKSK